MITILFVFNAVMHCVTNYWLMPGNYIKRYNPTINTLQARERPKTNVVLDL